MTPFLIALLFGILVGLIPGITLFTSLIILYPYLLTLDFTEVLVVYITIASTSQFFGSVSAILLSVPGSLTSLPALAEGHKLTKLGQADRAIMYSATGSFLGSVVALGLSLVLLDYYFLVYNLFTTEIRAILLSLALISFIVIGNNRWFINVLMVSSGLLIGLIGYDHSNMTSFLTFGSSYLANGLPTVSVVLGLYIIPYITTHFKKNNRITINRISVGGYLDTFKEIVSLRYTMIKSILIGYVTGFIPGLTYHVGTTFAYIIEKKRGSLRSLLAAETANNTGVFTQILPLLIVGIPIANSQALIYNMLESKGLILTPELLSTSIPYVMIAYILSAFICVFLAGKYVNWLRVLNNINFNHIYILVILILVIITYFAGSIYYQGLYYIIVLFTLLPIGFMLRRFDTMILVFSFLLHDFIFSAFKTLIYL